MRIGERRLLPAAREAGEETTLATDGFPCKTRVERGAGRRPLHTAQVIRMTLDRGPGGTPPGRRPENGYPDVVLDGGAMGPKSAAAAFAALAVLARALRKRGGG